jgi:hypothetical protein
MHIMFLGDILEGNVIYGIALYKLEKPFRHRRKPTLPLEVHASSAFRIGARCFARVRLSLKSAGTFKRSSPPCG